MTHDPRTIHGYFAIGREAQGLASERQKKQKISLGLGPAPNARKSFDFFLPFRFLAFRFTTDRKVSVSGSWVVRHT